MKYKMVIVATFVVIASMTTVAVIGIFKLGELVNAQQISLQFGDDVVTPSFIVENASAGQLEMVLYPSGETKTVYLPEAGDYKIVFNKEGELEATPLP